ncbi:MAG: replication initiation protein [Gammaproteobacteria bacterium]
MQITTQVQKKSLELKKHVGLIHSTNKLTLLERKISNALLYHAYENLLTHHEHEIHIPTLCVLIGYNSKDYKTIKQSLVSLISTVLEWNLIDKEKTEEEGIWMASSMLADAKIDGPICTYSYSNRMRELCYYPEFYGRLNMTVLAQFKSTYGIALYENCIRYQNISQTPWFDLPTYRKLMGVEDGKYEIFRDLNRRVIKPSVEEVNSKATIQVIPEYKKQGRVVVSIRFLISKKLDNEIELKTQKNDIEETILGRLIENYGCSTKQAQIFIDTYGEQYLLDKMTLIESSTSYRNGKIGHMLKYLEKALKEDYQSPRSSRENLEKLRIKREIDLALKKSHEEKMQQYRSYQNRELLNVFNNLKDKQKTTILKNFDNYIQTTLYYNVYIKDGLKNPLVSDRFGDFIREMHPELAKMTLPFEEFCKDIE